MKILKIHLNGFIDYAIISGKSKSTIGAELNHYINIEEDEEWISGKKFIGCMEVISSYMNDKLWGIRVGRHLDMHTLGVVYRISQKATTVEEGLFYCHDFLRRTFPAIGIKMKSGRGECKFELSLNSFPENISRIILETTLTVMGRELEMMFGEMTLKHSSPFYNNEYPSGWTKGKVFSLTFPLKTLKASLRHYTNSGMDILIPQYLKMIEKGKQNNSFTNRVKLAVLNLANPDLPSIETVAEVYHFGLRTFQRKLANEGVVFREMVDDIKKELASLLILHQQFQVANVSSILGFSDPSSFIRSFKKWFGKTPAQFRSGINIPQ